MTEAEIQAILTSADHPGDVRRLAEHALEVRAAARGAKAALESGDAATALILLGRAIR